jgi:hypothetical protein
MSEINNTPYSVNSPAYTPDLKSASQAANTQAASSTAVPGTATDVHAASSSAQPAAAGKTDAPPLPDLVGAKAPTNLSTPGGKIYRQSKPMSLAMALSLLIDLGSKTQMMQGESKTRYGQLQSEAAQAAANAQKDQVKGERQSAVQKLITSAVTFVAVSGMSLAGGALSFAPTKPSTSALGAWASASGNALSQLLNNLGDAIDSNAPGGGQYKAGEAKIQQALLNALAQVHQTSTQDSESHYQTAQKAVQSAIDMGRQVHDLMNQTAMSTLGNV